VAIDLKSAKGRDIALRLVDTADVVAENFRPGVMEKLGLGCATLRERKPALIYALGVGLRPRRPLCDKPGRTCCAGRCSG